MEIFHQGNNIAIPNTKYTRGLYYYGKYFYVFFKAYNDKKFYFQFTFIFNNSNTIRFIFKFPLKQLKISRTNAYYWNSSWNEWDKNVFIEVEIIIVKYIL